MNTLLFLLMFSCSLAVGETGEIPSVDNGAERNALENRAGNPDDGPGASEQVLRIPENSPAGTAVGTIATSTSDAGSELSYAITDGNAQGAFAIDAKTGLITVKDTRPLDFEANARFDLTVQVKDTAAKSGDDLRYGFAARLLKSGVDPQAVRRLLNHDTLRVTVVLDDVNELPTVRDRSFRIDEGSVEGTDLGVVNATDPDAGEKLTFGIIAGNTGDAFAVDAETGRITVHRDSLLNFQTNPCFELTVQVTDSAGMSDTAVVTVNLNEVAEQPAVAVRPTEVPGKETMSGMTPGPVPSDFATEKATGTSKESDSTVADVAAPADTVTTPQAGTALHARSSTVVRAAVAAFLASVSRRGDIATALAMVCLLWFATSRTGRPKFREVKGHDKLQDECKRLRDRISELENQIEQLQVANSELSDTLKEQRKELVAERAELDAELSRLADEREALRIEREQFEDEQRRFAGATSAESELDHALEGGSGDIFEVDEETEERPTFDESESGRSQEEIAEESRPTPAFDSSPGTDTVAYDPGCSTDDESIADYMRNLLGRTRGDGQQHAATQRSCDGGATLSAGAGQAILESERLVSDTSTESAGAPTELKAEVEIEEPAPEVSRARQSVDKQALRNNLDSFREIANLTARTAITRHARKKQKKRFLVAGSLTAASFVTAALLLNGKSWGINADNVVGWTAAGLGVVMIVELVRTTFFSKQTRSARRPSESAGE